MLVKPLYKIDENKLKLIVKSKNGPGKPIYREDLPKVLFNRAPRVLLGSKWFDDYSSTNKAVVCQTCLKPAALERHEVYGLYLYENEYVIKLEGIIKICKDCHDKIHGGFSSRLNLKYGFTRQPAPVSDCTDSKKYPWNFAKYLCVDGNLYPLYSV